MATKRRKRRATKRRNPSVARRAAAPRAANPRRRRRRRRNPAMSLAARPAARRAVNPSRRRRRRIGRRGNPTAMRIGEIFKDMIYGAGGAVLTRAIAGAVEGFIPGQFASNPLARPIVQVVVSVTAVRYGVKKFMGQKQADIAMLGGLISAGLQLADVYLPNVQGSITNILRAPVLVAPQAALPATAAQALAGMRGGYGDVYDVPLNSPAFRGLSGFGDVEEVPDGIFG